MSTSALARPPANHAARQIQEGATLAAAGRVPEACACFERVLQDDPKNAPALWQLGKTLLRANQHAEAAAVFARIIAERRTAPEPHFFLGLALQALNRPDAATASFRTATELKPDWPEAWSHLGHALGAARRFDEAEAALRHALTFKAYRAETFNHLGVIANARGEPAAAVECYLQAIGVNPKLFQAWTNLGNSLRALNQLNEALVAYRQSHALNPKNAFVKFNLALVLLLQGELTKEAWLKYEYRWVTLNCNPHRGFTQPLWRGAESLAGRSILLYAEQGLGDTIHFVRYAATLAALGATVHLEVQAALKGVLQGTPGAASIFAAGEPLPPFDFHCPLLSVPFALDTTLATIPAPPGYVTAPSARVAMWRERLVPTPKKRVGVVWRGNPKHANDANRSIAFERFQRVFDTAGCEFVSLQVGPNSTEAAALAAHPQCIDLTAAITDFSDTAALIAQLDLVLAVDTSVAHLAAALGKPVWILLPFSPDWRWLLHRDDSPWYPSVRLFRQPAIGDWDSVVEAVVRELTAGATVHAAA
jgi:tetratricopeptide (TPR) repeat protein